MNIQKRYLEKFFRSVYGTSWGAMTSNIDSFDELLLEIIPPIQSFKLIDRMIIMMKVLDYPNGLITDHLNQVINETKSEILAMKTLTEAEKCLHHFRQRLSVSFKDIPYESMFSQLINHKIGWYEQAETVLILRRYAKTPEEKRFARSNNPNDRYAKLRDSWRKGKNKFEKALKRKKVVYYEQKTFN